MIKNFKTQLLITFILLVVVVAVPIGVVSASISSNTVNEMALADANNITNSIYSIVDIKYKDLQAKLDGDLNVAISAVNNLGEIRVEKGETEVIGDLTYPLLYAGDKNLMLDTDIVDGIQYLVGGTATIFLLHDDEFVRVSTNVMKDGERAVGTTIKSDSPVYQTVMDKEVYYGRAFVVDNWYITGYAPLLNSVDEVVGIIYVGVSEKDENLFKTIKDYKISESGYAYVMDSTGELILHPSYEGHSLIEYDFAKDIIEEKDGSMEYEFDGVMKNVIFKYFEPWDWYIITTVDQEDLESKGYALALVIVSIGAVVFIVAIGLGLLLPRRLMKPIIAVKEYMNVLSTGDLTVQMDQKYLGRKDEIGETIRAAMEVTSNLQSLIGDIGSTSEQVASSSEELTATAEQYAKAVEEVAQTIGDIAQGASMQAENTANGNDKSGQLGSLVEEDIEHIARLNTATSKVSQLVGEGLTVIEELSSKTKANGEAISSVFTGIQKTNESVSRIGEASKMIASIADQTNLLALNAAIEAARAGDAGKGFAVVADEIRKLAEQSAESTKSIDVIIKTLTDDATVSAENMEIAIAMNQEQEISVKNTDDKFGSISEAMKETESVLDVLLKASELIGRHNEEVQEVIRNLSAVAEENAASTEEASASMEEQAASIQEISNSSEGLASLAEEMNELINRFKF